MLFKTGLKLSAEPPKLRFGSYFKSTILPSIPQTFGHYNLFPNRTPVNPAPIKMLGNDVVSNCTIAGPMHVSMLWNKIAGRNAIFTAADAIDDYGTACGYRGSPESDTGGDMVQVAQYWRNRGMRDYRAKRHQIAAYLSVDPTNLEHIYAASYMFDGGCGLGVTVRTGDDISFRMGETWRDNAQPIEGLHYVPLWGRDADGLLHFATWGADHTGTEAWLVQNLKEVVAVISQEQLNDTTGKTAEGFDLDALNADINAL